MDAKWEYFVSRCIELGFTPQSLADTIAQHYCSEFNYAQGPEIDHVVKMQKEFEDISFRIE